jgi:hypothetical protein
MSFRPSTRLLNDLSTERFFLIYATSGLRSTELLELIMEDINEEMRMLVPDKQSEVKKT